MKKTLLIASALLALTACSDNDSEPKSQQETSDITLNFKMVDAAGKDFKCGAKGLQIAGLTDITPNDARLYIHDISLVDQKGNLFPIELDQDSPWQHKNVALLDFEDGTDGCKFVIFGRPQSTETNSKVTGTVAGQGPWTAVSFTFGVPVELNHIEAQSAPAPLNVTGMDHGPTDGRQFLRIAFYQEEHSATDAYHLLSFRSVCNEQAADGNIPASADDCTKPNRPRYTLDKQGKFDPATDQIVLDVAAIFADYTVPGTNADATDLSPKGRIDCFSPLHNGNIPGPNDSLQIGAERCGKVYPPLGLDYQTGKASTNPQTVFSIQ